MQNKTSHKKIAIFTDIHFGKKNNSVIHNQDCLDFIDWFCHEVKKHKDITHIAFLGDWFENRSAINVMTFNMSLVGLMQLDKLGLPFYFVVGNHDLYMRQNRSVFSTKVFDLISNIIMVDDFKTDEDVLFSPYLFQNEYASLPKFSKFKYWLGHFEFKNFIVGGGRTMEFGADSHQFEKQSRILSGHFHKRQHSGNVTYLGNTFQLDYGDAFDNERGMSIFDTKENTLKFINYESGPKHFRIKLSDLAESSTTFPNKSYVRCLMDQDISYLDAEELREEMLSSNPGIRDFSLEESSSVNDGSSTLNESETLDFTSLNEALVDMIKSGVEATNIIKPDTLISIYKSL